MAGIDSALASLRGPDMADCLPAAPINQLARTLGLEFRQRTLTPGRTLQLFVQQVQLTNTGTTPVSGPVWLVLDNLSADATLYNSTGTTAKHYRKTAGRIERAMRRSRQRATRFTN